MTQKCIELYIDNHTSVDEVIQTGIHEFSHYILEYQNGHSEIWKQTTGLLMALVDIIVQRPPGTGIIWVSYEFGLNCTKLHNVDFETFVFQNFISTVYTI